MSETSSAQRMDPEAISASLKADKRPENVSDAEFEAAVREMSRVAYRRTVADHCGGLPAPPVGPPTVIRRVLAALERRILGIETSDLSVN